MNRVQTVLLGSFITYLVVGIYPSLEICDFGIHHGNIERFIKNENELHDRKELKELSESQVRERAQREWEEENRRWRVENGFENDNNSDRGTIGSPDKDRE